MKPVHISPRGVKILRAVGITSIVVAGIIGSIVLHATTYTPLAISQSPLQLVSATRPQVVIAVGNSQSMDGNLSGAILTGSGVLSANYAPLSASSSPVNYIVPTGFTAPYSNTASNGSNGPPVVAPTTTAPITSSDSSGVLYDNSESRLNLAKATVSNIVSTYLQTTDFALVSFPTSTTVLSTWVYYMSPPGGFTFTNAAPPTGIVPYVVGGSTVLVNNPCYNYLSNTTTEVYTDCVGIAAAAQFGTAAASATQLNTNLYMVTAASSDDANINDVLYSNSPPGFAVGFDYGNVKGKSSEVIVTSTGTVNYTSPYFSASNAGGYTLTDYKAGGSTVSVGYSADVKCCGSTSPTNAGFVPFSQQVMYSFRGFGYDLATSSVTTNVSMTNLGNATITPSTISTALSTFTPLLAPETNKGTTTELKAAAEQSPLGKLIAGANLAFKASGSSSDPGRTCATPEYIILVTDGQPTEDNSGNSWPPIGSGAAISLNLQVNPDGNYNLNPTYSASTGPGTGTGTNDQAVTDAYNAITTLNGGTTTNGVYTPSQQGTPGAVVTYVLGLGAGATSPDSTYNGCTTTGGCTTIQQGAQSVLNALAYAGGTVHYYPAASAASVQTALAAIMLDIQSHTLATVASSANSTHLSTNSVEYQATFTSSEPSNLDWTGELYAEGLTTGGAPTGTKLWSARALLTTGTTAAPASRAITTWTPAGAASGTAVPFEDPGTSGGGISAAQLTALQPSDSLGTQRLAYLRGDSTKELPPIGSGTFRKRTWHLGDIINSQPLFIGPSFGPYTTDSTYVAFATTTASRTKMIYVGANDGMLHAFVAGTGVEQFAYIPSGVFNNLVNLTAPSYNLNHQYFVDGSPQTADVNFTDARGWTTMLVGGEGGGGKSIYALDVTTPANNTEATVAVTPSASARPWVLWEYNGDGSDPDMGLTYSNPAVALTSVASSSTGSTNGFVVFFGNGYDSSTNKAKLYALNPQTGAVITSIDLCAATTHICDPSLPQGLSSVAVGNASGQPSQPVTTIYAGDLQGNLWAIDVSNALPSSWTVRCLYNGTAYNSVATVAAQPITTTPIVSLPPGYPARQGLIVMFATGQLLVPADMTSSTTQAIYGIWDVGASDATYTQPYASSLLEQQTLTYTSASPPTLPQPILTSTANTINWATQRGWYVNLSATGLAAGMRVLSDSVLFNAGLEVIMNSPPTPNVCSAPWTSFLLTVNYATGGAFTTPHLDINGDGLINASDLYSGTAPVGLGLGSGFASGINDFGLSGVNLITIANLADSGSVISAITDIGVGSASGAIADLNVSAANLTGATGSADIGISATAVTGVVSAITAAIHANPGNQELSIALADANLANTATIAAQTAISNGNTVLAAQDIALATADLNAANAALNEALGYLQAHPSPIFLLNNNSWWQVQ